MDDQKRPEGRKDDQNKLRYELLPPELGAAVAAVLSYGADKYSDRNWELGMNWSRPYAALGRHMAAWWGGEDCDPETGFSHLWHAGCCIAFLIAYEAREIGDDDRPDENIFGTTPSMGVFEEALGAALSLREVRLPSLSDTVLADMARSARQKLAPRVTFGPGVADKLSPLDRLYNALEAHATWGLVPERWLMTMDFYNSVQRDATIRAVPALGEPATSTIPYVLDLPVYIDEGISDFVLLPSQEETS